MTIINPSSAAPILIADSFPYNENTEWHPVTKEELQLLIGDERRSALSVVQTESDFLVTGLASSYEQLNNVLPEAADINELNYFAAKINKLGSDELEKFEAVLESGRHRGDTGAGVGEIADLINIVDNLDSFTFHSGFDTQGYGDHLLTGSDSVVERLIRELQNRSHGSNEEYAQYVECLRDCVNSEQFGEAMANENDGVFLTGGYLIEDGGFEEVYGGVQDIPDEYRIWEPDEVDFIRITYTELPGLLMEMHTLSGNYTQDAGTNFQALLSGECFILISAEKLTVLPSDQVLCKNSPESVAFNEALRSPTRVFFAEIKEMENYKYWGNIHELDPDVIVNQIADFGLTASHIDVEFKDGTNGLFTISEWENLSPEERGRAAVTEYRYESDRLDELNAFMRDLREAGEKGGNAFTREEFLTDLNTVFMGKAQNPQPGMYRIAREAAVSMLARDDAEVYRLTPQGAIRLSQMDAVKTKNLWFPEHREFAIRASHMTELRKWAERTVSGFTRRLMQAEHKKSLEGEL